VFHTEITTKEDGHGIGLPLIKRLVDQNQGTIRLVSTSGEGTEFELIFPLVKADAG
jgi:signal transduction histidine kinase